MNKINQKLKWWPFCLAGLVLCGTGVYFLLLKLGGPASIAVSAVAALTVVFVLLWALYFRRRLSKAMAEYCLAESEELLVRMEGLSYPYVLFGEDCRILWKNKAFQTLLAEDGDSFARAESISDIFPDTADWAMLLKKAEQGDVIYFTLGARTLRAYLDRLSPEHPTLTLLLSDETEHLAALQELSNQRNVIGLVYVDSFEELMKRTAPEKQGLLQVLIEQKISGYFRQFNCIVSRNERDRYLISMDAQSLGDCEEDRFSLLDLVKTIREGNSMAVSLSMTVGSEGESYADNLRMAQQAMDLALSRGGDQAIVKTPETVRYYGGKTLGEAAQTRVLARVKAQALKELLALSERIYIMGHSLGDNDSFGASIAVYRAAVSLQKPVYIVLDTVSFSVRPFWERFENAPEYPREMFLNGKDALERITEKDAVVVVDVNQAARTECPGLLEKTNRIVVFDHHRQASDAIPATLSYVEPYASSACEMTAEILQYFSESVKLLSLEAETIYSGIVVDTNSFTDRTGSRTFEAAAYLKRCGADLVTVKKLLRENYPEYRAKAEAMQKAEVFRGSFAFAECRAEGLDSPNVVGAQAANELLNIATIKASFVFTPVDGTVYVSARSIDEVNVQLIMERLGGGGHLSVAGAQFRNTTVPEAMKRVKGTIEQMIEEGAIG